MLPLPSPVVKVSRHPSGSFYNSSWTLVQSCSGVMRVRRTFSDCGMAFLVRLQDVHLHMGIDWICIFLEVIGCCPGRSERVLRNSKKKAIPTAMKAVELMGRVIARLARFSKLMDSWCIFRVWSFCIDEDWYLPVSFNAAYM